MSKLTIGINGGLLLGDKVYALEILKCSQEHCHPRKACETRVRPYHSLHFVTHGKGVLKIGDSEYQIGQGQAFLLFANRPYSYYPNVSDPWSYIWVDFLGEDIENMFSVCGFEKEKPFVKLQKFSEMTDNLKLMVEAYDEGEAQQILCAGYFLISFSQMLSNVDFLSQKNKGRSAKFKHVREALIYINNNFRLDLSIKEIAINVNISESYLLNLFSEEIGISPTQYVNMFRVATACELLKKPDMRIGEVADMVGFHDPLYFSHVFTKIKGCSPKFYAKNSKETNPFEFLEKNNIDFR